MDYFINFTPETKLIYAKFLAWLVNDELPADNIDEVIKAQSGDTSVEVLYSDKFLLVVQSVDSNIVVNNYIRVASNSWNEKSQDELFKESFSEEVY